MGLSRLWHRGLPRHVLSLSLGSLIFCLASQAAAPVAGRPLPAALLTSQPQLLHVVAGDAFPLTLEAGTGGDAEILLESSAPGIEYVVLAPDGRQVRRVAADYPGWLVLSFPVAGSGQYRVLTKALSAQQSVGVIAVRSTYRILAAADGHSRAEEIYAAAERLLRSPNAADLRQAILNDTQAGAAWAKAGDREGQVLALAGEARAWLGLSEHDKAIAALTRASRLCTASSYWHAWLANLQAQIYLDHWDNALAKERSEESYRLSRELKDDWLTADALADRGEAEYLTHDPAAKTDIAESVRLSRKSGAVGTLARALRCTAWIEKDQGHLSNAFVQMDQAREYFHQDGDIRAELQAMSTLSAIDNTSGDPYASLLRHTEIAGLMQQAGYTLHYGVLLQNIAADYVALNRYPDAILYYRQALTASRSTHHLADQALVLSDLCTAEMQENRLNDALRDCRSAAALVEQFHDPKRTATATWRLGKVQRAFGQTALAIESFRRATELSDTVHDARFESQAFLDWGDTVVSTDGQQKEAQRLFRSALVHGQAAENVSLQVEAHYRIAQTEFRAGENQDAKRDLDDALNNIEILRRKVGNADLQAAYFAQVRKCHNLYIDILMSEQQRDPASGAAAKALEKSESGRALTLLDALAARAAGPGTAQKAGQPQELGELHLAVEQAYDQRLKLMIEGGHKDELDANAAKLTLAIDQLERAEDEQRAAKRTSAAEAHPLSATQIAAASERGHSTLVEYELGAIRSYVWVVNGGRIESYVLPAQDRIAALVKQWRSLATARVAQPGESFADRQRRTEAADKELPGVASALSCMLLGPFLREGMDHLVIVPDGDLHLLPFAALPENGCKGGGVPIAAGRQVVLTPSLSVLLTRTEAKAEYRGQVALLADPVFDRDDSRVHKSSAAPAVGSARASFGAALPRLIGTRDEARAIADLVPPEGRALYLGFDANLQRLLSPSLGDYRILHLATHGVLDEGVPGFSGIVLSLVGQDGEPVFGYLKAHDIAGLNLRSDLVVLSSCDSGAGANLSGEGVTGMNHAFLSAGARRVISTLWSVDDGPTTKLMVALYTGMLREGLDPAEALRRSQVEMMSNPHTASPYYWAAFSLTSTVD